MTRPCLPDGVCSELIARSTKGPLRNGDQGGASEVGRYAGRNEVGYHESSVPATRFYALPQLCSTRFVPPLALVLRALAPALVTTSRASLGPKA